MFLHGRVDDNGGIDGLRGRLLHLLKDDNKTYIYINDHDFEFFSASASRCTCFKSLSALILASSSRTPF